MINKDYDTKIPHIKGHGAQKDANSAYQELLKYQKSMKKSDLANSTTRYETELDLLKDAIDEAQAKEQSGLLKKLEKIKEEITGQLEKLSCDKQKDKNPLQTYNPSFMGRISKRQKWKLQCPPRIYLLSEENQEIFDSFSEEKRIEFDKKQKEYGLTDDNTVRLLMFDDKQLKEFNAIKSQFGEDSMDFAVYYVLFDDMQKELFHYATEKLGFIPCDAIDFVYSYSDDYAEADIVDVFSNHEDLVDVMDEKTKLNTKDLFEYGINIPNMLDDNANSSNLWKKDVGFLRDEIIDDIAKLKKAYENVKYPPHTISLFSDNKVIQEEIQERLKDEFCPIVDSNEKLNDLDIGDVFRMKKGDKEILCILEKTDEGKEIVRKLDISADSYLKLFPPVLRYASLQNEKTGDCFLVSTLNVLYANKNTKGEILKRFKDNPDGSITVNTADGISYTFKDKVKKSHNLHGSLGMQALEIVYGKSLVCENLDKYTKQEWHDKMEEYAKRMKMLEQEDFNTWDRLTHDVCKKEMQELQEKIDMLNENMAIYAEAGEDIIKDSKENHRVRNNGGVFRDVCKRFGIDGTRCAGSAFVLRDYAEESGINNFYMATKGNSDKYYLDEDLGIAENHAYLAEYKDGKFYIANPWMSAQKIEVPENKIDEHSRMYYYVEN